MLLALVLAAAPVDVELMSMGELLIEDTRLEVTPSTAAPKMMIGLGLGIAAFSFSAMGVAIAELGALARRPPVLRKDGPGPDSFPAAVEIVGCIHGVLAAGTLIAGMLWYPSRAQEAEAAAAQRESVRARIAELEAVDAPYDPVQVALEQHRLLERARPSFALGGNLVFAGAVSLLAGALTLALMNGAGASATYAGIAELVAGGAMSAMGVWMLLQRTGEENALERRRERLFELLQ